jgi:hypothetical protein
MTAHPVRTRRIDRIAGDLRRFDHADIRMATLRALPPRRHDRSASARPPAESRSRATTVYPTLRGTQIRDYSGACHRIGTSIHPTRLCATIESLAHHTTNDGREPTSPAAALRGRPRARP